MANGAAGCGFEYRNHNGICGQLTTKETESKEGVLIEFGEGNTKKVIFSCLKYVETLETQRTTSHPFRCTKCIKSV